MASIGDVTMIWESIGEDARARGAEKVAAGVDKIRQGWSRGLEQMGKIQARMNFITSSLAAVGANQILGGGQREDLGTTGNAIQSAADTVLPFAGALVGQFIPFVGPMIGQLIGSHIGQGIANGIAPIITAVSDFFEDRSAEMRRAVADVTNRFELQNKRDFIENRKFVFALVDAEAKRRREANEVLAREIEITRQLLESADPMRDFRRERSAAGMRALRALETPEDDRSAALINIRDSILDTTRSMDQIFSRGLRA